MHLDLEQQILKVLRGMKSGDRPATVGDLARRLGASPQVVHGCFRQMVQNGTAKPHMVTINGVETLHGLLGQPAAPDIEPAMNASTS